MNQPVLRMAMGLAAALPSMALSGASVAAERAKVVAHRGASDIAPENTLAAFQLAWQLGADGIEGDFRLTKDGEIVCFHDSHTARTSNGQLIVANSTLAELQQLDVGSWKHERFRDQRMPTLAEVLETVPPGKLIFIEIKSGPEIVPALIKVVQQEKFAGIEKAIISFDRDVIEQCKQEMPEVRAYWITAFTPSAAHGWVPTTAEILETIRQIGADGLDCQAHREAVNEELVQQLHQRGLELHNWTVNDGDEAVRLQKLGGKSLTSDRPDWIRQFLISADLAEHIVQHYPLDQRPGADASDDFTLRIAGEVPAPETVVQGVFGKALQAAALQSAVPAEREMPAQGAVSLWYYPRSWKPHQVLWTASAGEQPQWGMEIDAQGGLTVHVGPAKARLRHQLHPKAGLNRWHHFVLTWDSQDRGRSAVELYAEGMRVAFAPWYTPEHPVPEATTFRWVPPQRTAAGDLVLPEGMIDDLMFLDRRVSAGDVHRIMQGDFSSPQTPAATGS